MRKILCVKLLTITGSSWAPYILRMEQRGPEQPSREWSCPLAMTLPVVPLTLSIDTNMPLICRSGYWEVNQHLFSALKDTVISPARDRHEMPLVSGQQPLSCWSHWVCLDWAVQSRKWFPAINWGWAAFMDVEAEQAEQQKTRPRLDTSFWLCTGCTGSRDDGLSTAYTPVEWRRWTGQCCIEQLLKSIPIM